MKLLLPLMLLASLSHAQNKFGFCKEEPTRSAVLEKLNEHIQSAPGPRLIGYDTSTYPGNYDFTPDGCCVSYNIASQDWPFRCPHSRMICVNSKTGIITYDDISHSAWCDY